MRNGKNFEWLYFYFSFKRWYQDTFIQWPHERKEKWHNIISKCIEQLNAQISTIYTERHNTSTFSGTLNMDRVSNPWYKPAQTHGHEHRYSLTCTAYIANFHTTPYILTQKHSHHLHTLLHTHLLNYTLRHTHANFN